MNAIKNLFNNSKQYISDYIYNIGGMLLLQGVLQLIVYPLINYFQGENILGDIVYYMGIVIILAQAAGYALCQIRLVSRKEYTTTNGDYFLIGGILSIVFAIVGGVIASFKISGCELVGFITILVLSIFRNYCAVQYRLILDFKFCFKYFLWISIGHIVGLGLYFVTDLWYLIFIVGEFAGIAYVFIKGTILKPEKLSQNIKVLSIAVLSLCLSYLLTYLTENADRIILHNMINAQAVSLYYAVSLIGKTALMFVGPINTITLSYVSANEKNLTKDEFLKTFKLYAVVGAVFYVLCLIGTPIFVKIFYPNLYDGIQGLNVIVNAAQIINLTASLPMILILASLGSKYHLKINALYASVYIPLGIAMAYLFGLKGYACASLVASIVKFATVFFIGYKKIPRNR